MPKTLIFTAQAILYLHVSTAAALCEDALVTCGQPDGQTETHGETLSAKHFDLLPNSFRTTLNSANATQPRPLITNNGTVQVARSGRSKSLLDNRFTVSNPEKAPIDFYGLRKNIDNDNLIGVFTSINPLTAITMIAANTALGM